MTTPPGLAHKASLISASQLHIPCMSRRAQPNETQDHVEDVESEQTYMWAQRILDGFREQEVKQEQDRRKYFQPYF